MRSRPFLAITLFGLAMAVIQVTLLRETLEVSSGNELSLALGLSAWLLGTTLGAGLGALAPARGARIGLTITGLLAALAPTAALALARGMPRLLQVPPGEPLTQGQQLLASAATFGPVCILIGAAFALSCRLPDIPPRRVYLAEALGWLLGGGTSTWVLGYWAPAFIVMAMGCVIFAAVLLLWRRGWTPAIIAVVGIFLLRFSPLLNKLEQTTADWRWPEQLVIENRYSPQGHGTVLEHIGQRALYENGRLSLLLPETQTAEELAHLALLQVQRPRRVFLIGALGGLLPEVLKHPVEQVMVAEHNPLITEMVTMPLVDKATERASEDPRVSIEYGDGRRMLERGKWDAIILALPEPSTVLANRYYTAEFFRQARASLNPGGVLAFPLPGVEVFNGNGLPARNDSVYRALTEAFSQVAVTASTTNYFLASDRPLTLDGRTLGCRLATRHITTRYVNQHYFEAMLPPGRAEALAAEYARPGPVNRDLTPVACLHGLALQARTGSGPLALALPILLLGLLLTAAPWRPRWPSRWGGLFAVAAVGCAGMGVNILLLLLVQLSLGALYHLIGAYIAAGMAGMALGAWGAARLPIRRLFIPIILELGVLLLLVLLAHVTPTWPFGLAALALAVPALLGGVAIGAAFSLAIDLGFSPTAAYAADLLGAAAAGLLIGAILLPAHGFTASAALLAVPLVAAMITAVLLQLKSHFE